MLRPSPVTSWSKESKSPVVAENAFVDEAAVVIGEVIIHAGSIVCPGAVLRADEGSPIEVGADTNVQDGVLMHALMNSEIRIGARCCIAHGAIVHGPCKLADEVFIGFRATLLNADVGSRCFIGHHAVVLNVKLPEGRFVPPGTVVATQEAADKLEPVTEAHRHFTQEVLQVNFQLRDGYLNLTR